MSAVAEGTGRVLQEIEFLKRVATNAKILILRIRARPANFAG